MQWISFDRNVSLSDRLGICRETVGTRSGTVRPGRVLHRGVMCRNNGYGGSEQPEADCHSALAERWLSLRILACHSVCWLPLCVSDKCTYRYKHITSVFLLLLFHLSLFNASLTDVRISQSSVWLGHLCRNGTWFSMQLLWRLWKPWRLKIVVFLLP